MSASCQFDYSAPKKRPQRICLESPIGTGKSTLLAKLQQDPMFPATIKQEPVHEWREIVDKDTGLDVLSTFYQDPKRNSFMFQMHTLTHRASMLRQIQARHTILYERSVLADRFCFMEMLVEQGMMTDLEKQIYESIYDQHCFACENLVLPTKVIYLRCSPQVSYARVKHRDREGESSITLDYMERLYAKHEAIFNEAACPYPVLILDGESDFKNCEETFMDMRKQILKFIQE